MGGGYLLEQSKDWYVAGVSASSLIGVLPCSSLVDMFILKGVLIGSDILTALECVLACTATN